MRFSRRENSSPRALGLGGHHRGYEFTPTEDLVITAETFESKFDPIVSVWTGSRGALTAVTCGFPLPRFTAVAGTTYFFMVGALSDRLGGHLVFNVNGAPPLKIDLSIDPVGSFDRAGRATIHGIATCSKPVSLFLSGGLSQRVGRLFIRGSFTTFLQSCDGETPWQATSSSEDGRFAGGAVETHVSTSVFDPETGILVHDSAFSVVKLKGKK